MQYFETAMREETGGCLNQAAWRSVPWDEDDVSFFIGIYSEMEEPDGLTGDASLMRPSLVHLRAL